jgi:hypothetical protein
MARTPFSRDGRRLSEAQIAFVLKPAHKDRRGDVLRLAGEYAGRILAEIQRRFIDDRSVPGRSVRYVTMLP